MSFQNTISGKEFCRRNCGSLSKEKFYEEYYRIIHTAYLRANGEQCIDIIRKDFEECFGSDLDNISVSYIYATTKYLVYDVIVSSLLKDGKVDSQYYYNKLVVDIGFDVWLIKSIEAETRLTMSDFYSWQPLPKTDKTDRQINDFWHFKLPKSHNFGHLYNAVAPFKTHIYETYLKLLTANTDFENDVKQLEAIIAFLKEELGVSDELAKAVQEVEEADSREAMESLEEKQVEETLAEEVKAADEEDQLAEQVKDIEAEDPFVLVDLEDEEDKEKVAEEAAAEEAAAEEAAVDEFPVAEAPAEEVPVEPEAVVDEVPAEPVIAEAPAEPVAEEVPAEPPVAEEAPAPVKALEPGDMMPYASLPSADAPIIKIVEPEPQKPLFVQGAKQFEKKEPVKGFKESGFKITKKKVVTAAVCLALASTVVVPLALLLGKKKK